MEEITLVLVQYLDPCGESLCGESLFSLEKAEEYLSKEKFDELLQKGVSSVDFYEDGCFNQQVIYKTIDVIKNSKGGIFIEVNRLKEFGYCDYFPELNK